MLNHISIMGRLVKDPEVRRFKETPVCTIRIACDRDFRNANGERETDFLDVVSWRKLAEIVGQYAAKGRMVSVEGRLQLRPWQDDDGKKRYFPEIVAERVYFCDPKPKDQNGQGAQNGGAASNGGYGQAPANGGGYGTSDGYGSYGRNGYGQPPANGGHNTANNNYAQASGNNGNGGYSVGNPGNGGASGYGAAAGYAGNANGYGGANAYAAPPDGFVPEFQDEGVVAEFNEEDGNLPF